MEEIDDNFKTLRINLRRHGMAIAENAVKRHHPIGVDPPNEICIFCASSSNITREHALPKWLFEKDPDDTMVSSVNKQTVTFNKAVVPACASCNNEVLGKIERYIIGLIHQMAAIDDCSNEDACHIMRWLELMDYKLQVLDCRRKYLKYGRSEYNREFGIFPVAMMRHLLALRPWKAYHWLRNAQRRIAVKEKISRINSLVIIKPRIPHFYFFSQPNEYLYISFPMCKLAFFYFFKRQFDDYESAASEALTIIQKVAGSD